MMALQGKVRGKGKEKESPLPLREGARRRGPMMAGSSPAMTCVERAFARSNA